MREWSDSQRSGQSLHKKYRLLSCRLCVTSEGGRLWAGIELFRTKAERLSSAMRRPVSLLLPLSANVYAPNIGLKGQMSIILSGVPTYLSPALDQKC